MSGIAAIINRQGSEPSEELIKDMASMMIRRGPHSQNYWSDSHVAMAHTLLPTTVESENECQPSTLTGDVWITADVRIDARDELINKLKGYIPSLSNDITDDKLILSAYQIWGIDCLKHMIGDFAFILWDSTKQRLLCATDQFGVAPLYHSKTNDGLCISNTLNAIRLHPDVKDDLDQIAIADYLLFRINENSHGTFFEHIKHLPAGHFLIHENDTTHIKRYWDFEPRGQLNHSQASDYVDEFTDLLKHAVADRSRTHSVGVHLSGGMDSSSVTAVASELIVEQNTLQTLTAYTYGASGDLPDLETPLARDIAQQLGLENHICMQSKNDLKKHTTPAELHSPEPRFTSRETENYALLEHVSTHSSVLMTGFGGDPLLRSQGIRSGDLNSPTKLFWMLKHAQNHWKLFGKKPPLGLRADSKSALKKKVINRNIPLWLNPEFAKKHHLTERYHAILENKLNPSGAQESMTNAGLWRRIFCWNDPGFTHIPVKVVHPFFDTRLLTFAQNLPPFPWLHDKTILRQAMTPYLPESILKRPKTPLPGNGLQAVLASSSDFEHYKNLLNNTLLNQFIDSTQLKYVFINGNNSTKKDFKSIMRIVTLSDWLNGVANYPMKPSINGNKHHVKRIKH